MRIVLVTGTVGVGKSTTGYAIAERAASQGRPAAFLDVDELSRLWPARAGDPFNTHLILRNLASLVGNYADAGAELLVLAWVVQDTDALVRLEEAVGASVVAIRLCAPASTLETRLRQRHQGAESDGLAWHLDRAPELAAIEHRANDAVGTARADALPIGGPVPAPEPTTAEVRAWAIATVLDVSDRRTPAAGDPGSSSSRNRVTPSP